VRMVKRTGDDEDFKMETLFDDQMVLATHPHNRWASRRKIKLAELIEREFGGFTPPPQFDD